MSIPEEILLLPSWLFVVAWRSWRSWGLGGGFSCEPRLADIWNPERLSVDYNTSQAVLRQILLFQSQKSEVW